MRTFFKYGGLFIFTFSYLFVPGLNNILDYQINYMYISSVVANSFYDEVSSVSTDEKMIVKDYIIEDNKLYIFPLSNEIKLPIGVMVAGKNQNFLEVVSLNDRYYIYNIDSTNVKLYEYISNQKKLGNTNSYYLIVGNNLDRIINQLEIHYEKV